MQAAGDEFAVEVPNRQTKILKVQFGRVVGRHIQWIDVGQQMPANAICVDELQYIGLFFDLLRAAITAEKLWIMIFGPTERRIIDLKIAKDRVVKLMLAKQEFVNCCQEQATFGALDHAVVVCVCKGDRLADADLRERRGGHSLVLSRIFDRAGRNNQALAGHQTWVRGRSADRAGIG